MTTLSVHQVALADLEPELALTRRVLERVPDAHLGWRPHEKSMTLGGLARHIANILFWQSTILEAGEYDLAAGSPARLGEPESAAQVLREFDEKHAGVKRAVAGVDEVALAQPWTLRSGEHVVFTEPRFAALRRMGISHLVHHRAQLGVYLRLLDIPVPSAYGPTADEQ